MSVKCISFTRLDITKDGRIFSGRIFEGPRSANPEELIYGSVVDHFQAIVHTDDLYEACVKAREMYKSEKFRCSRIFEPSEETMASYSAELEDLNGALADHAG